MSRSRLIFSATVEGSFASTGVVHKSGPGYAFRRVSSGPNGGATVGREEGRRHTRTQKRPLFITSFNNVPTTSKSRERRRRRTADVLSPRGLRSVQPFDLYNNNITTIIPTPRVYLIDASHRRRVVSAALQPPRGDRLYKNIVLRATKI